MSSMKKTTLFDSKVCLDLKVPTTTTTTTTQRGNFIKKNNDRAMKSMSQLKNSEPITVQEKNREQLKQYLDYCRALQSATSGSSGNGSARSSPVESLSTNSRNSPPSGSIAGFSNQSAANNKARYQQDFLLDRWLENEFQKNFKFLNYLIQQNEHHYASTSFSAETSEIFFIRRHYGRHHYRRSSRRYSHLTSFNDDDELNNDGCQYRKNIDHQKHDNDESDRLTVNNCGAVNSNLETCTTTSSSNVIIQSNSVIDSKSQQPTSFISPPPTTTTWLNAWLRSGTTNPIIEQQKSRFKKTTTESDGEEFRRRYWKKNKPKLMQNIDKNRRQSTPSFSTTNDTFFQSLVSNTQRPNCLPTKSSSNYRFSTGSYNENNDDADHDHHNRNAIHSNRKSNCDSKLFNQTTVDLNKQPFKNSRQFEQKLDCIERMLGQLSSCCDNNNSQSLSTVEQNESVVLEQDFVCLLLTRPYEKMSRDSLVYSYPDRTKFTDLSGLFVTLSDVILLASNKTANQTPNQTMTKNFFSTSSFQFIGDKKNGSKTIQQKYFVSFVTERFSDPVLAAATTIESNNTKETANSKQLKKIPIVPLILLVAMPSDRYSETDVLGVVHAMTHLIQMRFGSFSEIFRSFFLTKQTELCIKYLDQISSMLALMFCFSTDCSRWNSSLSLSNAFFISLSARAALTATEDFHQNNLSSSASKFCESRATTLLVQQLLIDDSLEFDLCKYLNDYDSLEWLDESSQFYKISTDIEQALSEHFARCLSTDPSTMAEKISCVPPVTTIDHHRLSGTNPNQLFDIFMVELSSFTVIGSCLFFKGFEVKSHLPAPYLSLIRQTLFARGLLAATKHRSYDLVYFTRFNFDHSHHNSQVFSQNQSSHGQQKLKKSSQQDRFLLIIGHGHLLHCIIVEVFRFDNSGWSFSSKNSSATINKTTSTTTMTTSSLAGNKNQQTKPPSFINGSFQLPSSFAFYVFIKESYRLMMFYTRKFSLQESLENCYRFVRETSRRSILSSIERQLKASWDSNWKNRLKSFSKTLTIKQSFVEAKESYFREKYQRKNQNISPSVSFNDFSDIRSVSDDDGSNDGTQSSDDDHNHRSMLMFDTTMAFDVDSNPLYRFTKDCLPESLICYFNIEYDELIETFAAPILDGFTSDNDTGQLKRSSSSPPKINKFDQNRWLSIIVADLFEEICKLRDILLSMSVSRIQQRQRLRMAISKGQSDCDMSKYSEPKTLKTANTIKLFYDIVNGLRYMNSDQTTSTPPELICLEFAILGRLKIVTNFHLVEPLDYVSDEFYACFKLNRRSSSSSSLSSTSLSSSKSLKKSNFWSDLHNSGHLSGNTSNSGTVVANNTDRTQQRSSSLNYEMNQIDFLLIDLDELVQNVRMESRR